MESIHGRLPVKTIILYAVPGKEPFYRKLGYYRLLTGMAKRDEDLEVFRSNGYIDYIAGSGIWVHADTKHDAFLSL